MRDSVIFEITKEHLQKGLRDIPVGYSSTSYVDPEKGVFYVGRSLFELILRNPMEVVYLLLHGREPSEAEARFFAAEIEKRAALSEEFLTELKKLTTRVDPLSSFSMALLLLGSFENKNDPKEDCLNIIAKLPQIIAHLVHLYEGGSALSEMQNDLGVLENFIEMLPLSSKQKEKFSELFPLLQILFYDDEGGAIDAFVGKSVASAHVDLYKSLSAAMVAFSGNLAGSSCLGGLDLLQQIEEQTQGVLAREDVERILIAKLEKKELLYGFGHPSLCVEDTRATLLYHFARNHYSDHPLVKIALHLRYEAPRVLSAFFPNISRPFANVHAISGALLQAVGFTQARYYPLLFAMARSVGIVIQILHETTHRDRLNLVHPHYFYRLR